MSKDNSKTATLSAANIVPAADKLESALETVEVKGQTMVKAYECLPAGKTSWFNAFGPGTRYIESAVFLAILINCNACKMTRAGRLEAVTSKPFAKGLIPMLYGTNRPYTNHKKEGRLNDDGLTVEGINHFGVTRLAKDTNHSWGTVA